MRIDPLEVFDRGIHDPFVLSIEERLIFLVMDLEACATMEGWDHFFTSDRMVFYEELKEGLRNSGNIESTSVIENYENYLQNRNVPMKPDAIEDYLCNMKDDDSHIDWRDEFENLTEIRWTKIIDYLKARGIEVEN